MGALALGSTALDSGASALPLSVPSLLTQACEFSMSFGGGCDA